MKRNTLIFLAGIITLVVLVALPEFADAQCAMCKASAESNQHAKGEQHFGANLNSAILYLMAIPYFVLTFLAFLFFKKEIMAKLGKMFPSLSRN